MTQRLLTTLAVAFLFLILLGAGLRSPQTDPAPSLPVPVVDGEKPPAAKAADFQATASPLVTGRIVDEQGRPVPGTEVRFTLDRESRLFEELSAAEQERIHSVRSDALGSFQIEALMPGAPYDVVVVRRGYATLLTALSPFPVGLTPELRLVLRPGKIARGLVLDGQGRPVAGLDVRLERSTVGGIFTDVPLKKVWPDRELHHAVTGPDGRFEIVDLPEQTLDLWIWGSTFAPLSRRGIVLPADREVVDLGTFRLQPGATIEGRVADRQGTPIPGAVIGLRSQDTPVTESGRDGRFVVHGLSLDSELYVSVCRPGYQTFSGWLAASAPEAAHVILEPAARVDGRVLSPDGSPIAGAKVRASLDGSGRSWLSTAAPCQPSDFAERTTDAHGGFSVEDLSPGAVSLWVMAEGHPKEVLNVEAGASSAPGVSTSPLTVTLRPGAVLAGRILDPAGRPVSGAAISDDSNIHGHPRALSGPDGTYRLAGVAAGARSIGVSHPDHEHMSKTLRIAPGENRFDAKLARIPRYPIRGRVLSPDGQPVAGARVVSNGKVAAATAADGSFVLLVDDGGSYSLHSQAGSHGPAEKSVHVSGAPVDGLDLRLSRGITLTGQVVGIAPEELAEATVSALSLGSPSNMFWQAAVDSAGRYRMPGLFPGKWTIYAGPLQREQSAELVLMPVDEERELDLLLPEAFQVRGRVIGPDGEPVAGARVLFSLAANKTGASTAADGSFSVNVREGTYEVKAEGLEVGYLEALAPPLVVRGPAEGIEIRLPKGLSLHGRITGLQPEDLRDVSVDAHSGSHWETATITREGGYRLHGLSSGTWEVLARHGVDTATGKVRLEPGMGDVALDLTFVPGDLTLSGRVAGAANLPSLFLELRWVEGMNQSVWTEADEKGEFRFTRLHPGKYSLTVHGGGILPMTEIEMSQDREVVVDLKRGAGER